MGDAIPLVVAKFVCIACTFVVVVLFIVSAVVALTGEVFGSGVAIVLIDELSATVALVSDISTVLGTVVAFCFLFAVTAVREDIVWIVTRPVLAFVGPVFVALLVVIAAEVSESFVDSDLLFCVVFAMTELVRTLVVTGYSADVIVVVIVPCMCLFSFVVDVCVVVLVALAAKVSEGTVEVVDVDSCNFVVLFETDILFVVWMNSVFSIVLTMTELVCTSVATARDVDVVGTAGVPWIIVADATFAVVLAMSIVVRFGIKGVVMVGTTDLFVAVVGMTAVFVVVITLKRIVEVVLVIVASAVGDVYVVADIVLITSVVVFAYCFFVRLDATALIVLLLVALEVAF